MAIPVDLEDGINDGFFTAVEAMVGPWWDHGLSRGRVVSGHVSAFSKCKIKMMERYVALILCGNNIGFSI